MLDKLISFFSNNKQKPLVQVDNLTLYHFSGCIFCFKVRFAMTRLGIIFDMRNIHQKSQHRLDLKQGGGRTTVPCLKIEESGETRWMYESDDIVNYLRANYA